MWLFKLPYFSQLAPWYSTNKMKQSTHYNNLENTLWHSNDSNFEVSILTNYNLMRKVIVNC